jgi:hypothetical protein
MKITPPADDYGLQSLKQANSHREIKETGKVEAYPRIESDEERHEPKEPMRVKRRQQGRRQRERRLANTTSVLDTRDHRERRRDERREEEEEAAASGDNSAGHGIDDFA